MTSGNIHKIRNNRKGCDGLVIGLRSDDHASEQAGIGMAFHQPAAHQASSDDFPWATEESVEQGGEILGDELDGYGSGLQLKDLSSMDRDHLITDLWASSECTAQAKESPGVEVLLELK